MEAATKGTFFFGGGSTYGLNSIIPLCGREQNGAGRELRILGPSQRHRGFSCCHPVEPENLRELSCTDLVGCLRTALHSPFQPILLLVVLFVSASLFVLKVLCLVLLDVISVGSTSTRLEHEEKI